MNKLFTLVLFVVLGAFSLASAAAVVRGVKTPTPPAVQSNDIVVRELSDASVNSYDSLLETGDYYLVGPFPLGQGNATFAGFQCFYPKAWITAGDSLTINYQLMPSLNIADTVTALWTALDTVAGDAGKVGTYVSLASKAAVGVVFRIYDLDATAATIAKRARVVFKRGETYNVN
jgi:hypothetical protein